MPDGFHAIILRRQNSNKLMEQKTKTEEIAWWQAIILYRERQKRQTFPFLKNQTLCHLCLVALVLVFYGCQTADKDEPLTAENIRIAYQDFFQTIQSQKTVGTEELISLTKEWRQLEQADSEGQTSDTASIPYAHISKDRVVWNDSIHLQLRRLISSRPRSLADYIAVVRSLNDIKMDSVSIGLVSAIHRFYRKANRKFSAFSGRKMWHSALSFIIFLF